MLPAFFSHLPPLKAKRSGPIDLRHFRSVAIRGPSTWFSSCRPPHKPQLNNNATKRPFNVHKRKDSARKNCCASPPPGLRDQDQGTGRVVKVWSKSSLAFLRRELDLRGAEGSLCKLGINMFDPKARGGGKEISCGTVEVLGKDGTI